MPAETQEDGSVRAICNMRLVIAITPEDELISPSKPLSLASSMSSVILLYTYSRDYLSANCPAQAGDALTLM